MLYLRKFTCIEFVVIVSDIYSHADRVRKMCWTLEGLLVEMHRLYCHKRNGCRVMDGVPLLRARQKNFLSVSKSKLVERQSTHLFTLFQC